jgi:RNA polymerase sigma-70 factor (ECF subfamily)
MNRDRSEVTAPVDTTTGIDDLGDWLAASYSRAYRTAFLIVRNRSDAEEAVQDAFLRVWRFRDSLPEGPGREPWLYRVIVNACHSFLRREIPRRDRRADDSGVDRVTDPRTPETIAADGETEAVIAAAIAGLPDHLRIPVVLRYWTGLSEREIAKAIQRRPGTVKSRLHEARRRLADDPAIAGLEVQG